MESVLIPIMYKVPSESNVEAVKVTADVVDGKSEPTYIKKPKENKAV
jgi:ATP-dependent Clp protease ATP-binding subunit ClpX